jgi:5-methylcytosine-specific restriction endonuclease McrA
MTYIQPYSSVLVLNSSFEPINITSWKRAILLLVKEKATLLAHNVIRLVKYVKLPFSRVMANMPTRPLVYKRDNHTCQYCGAKEELTIDHVLPSSRGGDDSWENMVTCCLKCNLKKGNKLLKETNMVLANKPMRPFNKMTLTISTSGVKEWKEYCFST